MDKKARFRDTYGFTRRPQKADMIQGVKEAAVTKTTAVLASVALVIAALLGGCATTLHPERVNQPVENRGDLDLPLVIGNLAVPGGTLFLIHDVGNGSIYKPKEPAPAKP